MPGFHSREHAHETMPKRSCSRDEQAAPSRALTAGGQNAPVGFAVIFAVSLYS
jgi:hypothetical protein